ncbi:MAG: ATP-binding cassette domain-containing protein [Rhizobacter sp.]
MITEALADRLPPEMLSSEREAWDGPIDEPMPQRGATLLTLTGAQVRFGARCFGPFDLGVEAGERIAILGPSGAGKSTLLKLIVGDHAACDGAVRLDGQALTAGSAQALARRRAVLPQGHAVAFGLPVELVVALGRIACEPDPQQPAIVTASLAAASASHLAGRRFDTLSGGEQARVQLARVFAQLWDVRGGLLLVDEPLAALDPGLQFELMDALQTHARERGHALIAVLHDINHALAHFERLWLVREGRLIADLPAGRGAIGALEQLYGIALHCVDDAQHGLAVLARPAASPLRGLPTR